MVDSINRLNGIKNLTVNGVKAGQTNARTNLNSVFSPGEDLIGQLRGSGNPEIERALEELGFKKEPTEKQVAARRKLDEKVSSTGMKYKDAKAVISKLTEAYGKDGQYQSKFESEQPKDGRMIYIMPYKAFDPHKLPEPAKSEYFEALATMQEIEGANSALVQQTGLPLTKTPSQNYSNGQTVDELDDMLNIR